MDLMLLGDETNGVFEVSLNAEISATIAEAISRASDEKRTITFLFSGVLVTAGESDDAAALHRDWDRALRGYIPREVGPYPAPQLTEAEQAKDAQMAALAQARRAEMREAAHHRRAADQAALQSALSSAPPMSVVDPDAWEAFKTANTADGFSTGVVEFIERWARLMEAEINDGRTVAQVARRTLELADQGLAGSPYAMAVATLGQHWPHGKDLLMWHNRPVVVVNAAETANASGAVSGPALNGNGNAAPAHDAAAPRDSSRVAARRDPTHRRDPNHRPPR